MKRTSASLKLIARQQLSGNYGTPMAGILLLGLCSFLPSFLFLLRWVPVQQWDWLLRRF